MSDSNNEKDKICMRRIEDYLQEFGNEGVGKGAKVDLVRQQIIDAFRKEVFDLISRRSPDETKAIENIKKNATKKWRSLVKVFNRYRETYGMLKIEDIDDLLKEQNEMYDPFDGFDDEEEHVIAAE